VYVQPYTKKDGTRVEGHYRTSPNSTNTDNFSTKPNTNPYTGKPGSIEPDNKTNDNSYSYPNSGNSQYGSYSTPTYGKLSFYTNYGAGGAVDLYIDGGYVGTLTNYFPNGTPNCTDNNIFYTNLRPGTYSYKAVDKTGFYWAGSIAIGSNDCKTVPLFDLKENRFNLGTTNAKKRRVRIINYVLPFVSTVVFPPLGLGVSSLMAVSPRINTRTGDPNYDKGFRKAARKKKAIRIGISFGAGFATWFAISKII